MGIRDRRRRFSRRLTTMHDKRIRIAVLDDWQSVARQSADWTKLQQRAELVQRLGQFVRSGKRLFEESEVGPLLQFRPVRALPCDALPVVQHGKAYSFVVHGRHAFGKIGTDGHGFPVPQAFGEFIEFVAHALQALLAEHKIHRWRRGFRHADDRLRRAPEVLT